MRLSLQNKSASYICLHFWDKQVKAWLDGELSPLLSRMVCRHLERCPKCRESEVFYRDVAKALQLPAPEHSDLVMRILMQLPAMPAENVRRSKLKPAMAAGSLLLASCAAFALARYEKTAVTTAEHTVPARQHISQAETPHRPASTAGRAGDRKNLTEIVVSPDPTSEAADKMTAQYFASEKGRELLHEARSAVRKNGLNNGRELRLATTVTDPAATANDLLTWAHKHGIAGEVLLPGKYVERDHVYLNLLVPSARVSILKNALRVLAAEKHYHHMKNAMQILHPHYTAVDTARPMVTSTVMQKVTVRLDKRSLK